MIITITGTIGSGKTTVGKIVAEKLKYEFYSMGHVFRDIATKKGITIDELQKIQETDKSIDNEVDDYQRNMGKTKDNFIIDSRLGWHFIPNSLKIYIKTEIGEAARRIFNDPRANEIKAANIEGLITQIKERYKSEKKRYATYYGVDPSL
jgi:CMP/dCMP kinase